MPLMTVSTAATALGIAAWQLRNLYNRSLVPEPPRFGHSRAIRPDDLPVLRRAAQAAGYIREGGDE